MRAPRVVLAAVDVRHRCRVDHEVGLGGAKHAFDRDGICHVERLTIEEETIVTAETCPQIGAELPSGSGYEHTHAVSFVLDRNTLLCVPCVSS
jgi:hypothetical protein